MAQASEQARVVASSRDRSTNRASRQSDRAREIRDSLLVSIEDDNTPQSDQPLSISGQLPEHQNTDQQPGGLAGSSEGTGGGDETSEEQTPLPVEPGSGDGSLYRHLDLRA